MQTPGLKGAKLSEQQERVWEWSREDQSLYRVQCAVWLQGTFQTTQFLHALQQVVETHEILHTTFRTGHNQEWPSL